MSDGVDALAAEGQVTGGSDPARARRRDLAGWLLLLGALLVGVGTLVDALREPTDPATLRRSWSSSLADGFRGSAELAARLGLRVARQEASWGNLPPAREATLVVADPLSMGRTFGPGADLDGPQLRALGRWVEAGGHLVLTTAGRHQVDLVGADLEAATAGVDVTTAIIATDVITTRLELPAPLTASPPLALDPGRLEALSQREEVLEAGWLTWSGRPLRFGEARKGAPQVQVFYPGLYPEGFTPRVRLGEQALVLEAKRGEGRVWLVATAYPFTTLALARGGSAPLVAGLLHEATDGGRRALVLDERCHGLGARRGVLAPLRRAGLGLPVLALGVVVALVAWRGAVREGSPRPARGVPRRAKEEFVVALGELLRRGGRHDAAARALAQAWRERLAPFGHAAEADRLLAAAPRPLDDAGLAALAAALRDAARRAAAGEPVGLGGGVPAGAIG